jgi:glycosyltransferase involved in cell wall biosynthesis
MDTHPSFQKQRLRLCRVVTVPFFFRHHLRSTIAATVEAGYETHLVCSQGPGFDALTRIKGVHVHEINIERDIALFKDLRSLFELYSFLRRGQFDLVHSCTPKAGLLTAIAAFLARVPLRFHTFTGQAWLLKTGLLRKVAKLCDRVILSLNTKCYADGFSQIEELIAERVTSENRIAVLGKGSLSGVDANIFDPELLSQNEKELIKNELSIPDSAIVINFTGRLNKDKGIDVLFEAFKSVSEKHPECHLLIVGPQDETSNGLGASQLQALKSHPRIHVTGYTDKPQNFLSISDIFCLPSFREGFPNVILEAALMGIPSIGSDVVGVKDTILPGKTGILVPPKDARALAENLNLLVEDGDLRLRLGENARNYALPHFEQGIVNKKILDEYSSMLQSVAHKKKYLRVKKFIV